MKRLRNHSHSKKKQEILSVNELASRLIDIGKTQSCKDHNRTIKAELRRQKKKLQQHTMIGAHFTLDEVNKALNKTKLNKAAGFDGIYPEFIKYAGPRARE
jgi:urease beta subunit|uniref:Uncharacterized protein n=1 Tax=Sipha flava TaxID=143950 RepID=A0A2S2R771_9HEMI